MKKYFVFLSMSTIILLSACSSGSAAEAAEDSSAEELVVEQLPESITSSEDTVSHGGELDGYVSLVDLLRAQGATVEPDSIITESPFSVPAQQIFVDGHGVQVFEYPDSAAMEADASTVSPNGVIGESDMIPVEPPYFYKGGRVIVVYYSIGGETPVIATLESVLGPTFAGGSGGGLP